MVVQERDFSSDKNISEAFCRSCQIPKWSKSQHCRICKNCMPGRHHHCFWLNTCIGDSNMKAFYQLLLSLLLWITFSIYEVWKVLEGSLFVMWWNTVGIAGVYAAFLLTWIRRKMDHPKDTYNSIFSIRYKPSPEILTLFSEKNRIITWRKLWIYLATAQKELGLAIDVSQINELTDQLENIDWDYAAQKEKEFRHDVMAHIHAFKHVCPSAGGILHQGATSAFVQDNTELILIKEALLLVGSKVLRCIDRLAKFAEKWKSEPTVGRTHYQ